MNGYVFFMGGHAAHEMINRSEFENGSLQKVEGAGSTVCRV
ncbi:MAG: hypothetical protein OCC49_09175 [Fibrobacterales bacterium]